jgi:DTW domain-containing protein YfiP
MPHAVARLRAERLARSTKPFRARGSRVFRCGRCRLPEANCMCALRPSVTCRSGVCLVMHEIEPMKPTNTGWLVADVVADTHAFTWSRTQPDARLLALLDDPGRRPYVVFPSRRAAAGRVVADVGPADARRPLFVLLDGTWAEAHKMFRKSPYLDRFPVLSVDSARASRYRLRRTKDDAQLCTAEVAASCLRLAGDAAAAEALDAWLDVFIARTEDMRNCRRSEPEGGEVRA